MTQIPDKPTLDGLEAKWRARWEAEGTYRFDRTKTRAEVYSIDTPPPTVSGTLHPGHLFSYTHTDLIARYQRMRGKEVFYPMGWDDNGLNVERRVQLLTGTNVDPTLPYDPDFRRPEKVDPKARTVAISRPNFIELCEQVVPEFEAAYQDLWSNVGLSVDWDHTYTSIGSKATRTSQRGFLRLVQTRPRLPQRVAHAVGRRHAHVGRPGRAGRPRAARGVPQARLHRSRRRPAADRHDPARAAARLRRRRGPPRRRALPAAVRPAGHHAAVRRRRCRSSPTSWPSPTRAPASP